MKSIHIAFLLLLTSAFAIAQTPDRTFGPQEALQTAQRNDKMPEVECRRPDDQADTAGPARTAPAKYARPTSKASFNYYVKSMFGPMAFGKTVLSAGYSTWRNSPEEWGDHWEGFGKRVASSLGKSVIKHTIIYGLDETLTLDSRYYRSEKKDVGSKIKNALISPVTARNSSGKRVFGTPRIVGTYASSIIAAETWFPGRYNYKDGLKNGTVSLGMNAAFNLVKEFIWKK